MERPRELFRNDSVQIGINSFFGTKYFVHKFVWKTKDKAFFDDYAHLDIIKELEREQEKNYYVVRIDFLKPFNFELKKEIVYNKYDGYRKYIVDFVFNYENNGELKNVSDFYSYKINNVFFNERNVFQDEHKITADILESIIFFWDKYALCQNEKLNKEVKELKRVIKEYIVVEKIGWKNEKAFYRLQKKSKNKSNFFFQVFD